MAGGMTPAHVTSTENDDRRGYTCRAALGDALSPHFAEARGSRDRCVGLKMRSSCLQGGGERKRERLEHLPAMRRPTTAFRIGEKVSNPRDMYLSDVFSVEVNMAGIPAMSVRAASRTGSPSACRSSVRICRRDALAYSHMYQSQTDWHTSIRPAGMIRATLVLSGVAQSATQTKGEYRTYYASTALA